MRAAEASVRRLDESLDEAGLNRTAGGAFIAFQPLHLLVLRRQVVGFRSAVATSRQGYNDIALRLDGATELGRTCSRQRIAKQEALLTVKTSQSSRTVSLSA